MTKQILVGMAMAALLVPFTSRADDAMPAHENYISGLLGAAVVTSSGGSNDFTFSGRAGTSFLSSPSGLASAGLFIDHLASSTGVGTATISGATTILAAEIMTRRAFNTGLYFGGRLGLGLEGVDVSAPGSPTVSASATSFVIGPVAGYEIPIQTGFAATLDASWISVGGATFTFPSGTSVTTSAENGFLFQGGLTYRW